MQPMVTANLTPITGKTPANPANDIANDRKTVLGCIPRKIAPFGYRDEARGEIFPGTRFMPFYYGDGELWWVMDLDTCKRIEVPPLEIYGPPAPLWSRVDRLAETEIQKHRIVYFIGTLDTAIKIGTSYSAADRFKTIQSMSPIPLEILAVRQGGETVENAYHHWFYEHRLHGEWFSPHADILAEIERLNAEVRHG